MPPPYQPKYKLSHEVLPYDLELSLPENIVDNIYSFLRRRKDPKFIKQERLTMYLNHKITAFQKLQQEKLRRLLERKKQNELRTKIVDTLDKLTKILESQL